MRKSRIILCLFSIIWTVINTSDSLDSGYFKKQCLTDGYNATLLLQTTVYQQFICFSSCIARSSCFGAVFIPTTLNTSSWDCALWSYSRLPPYCPPTDTPSSSIWMRIDPPCPESFQKVRANCYWVVVNAQRSWTEAQRMCEMRDAALLSIDSDEEFKAVFPLMRPHSASGQIFWIAEGSSSSESGSGADLCNSVLVHSSLVSTASGCEDLGNFVCERRP